MKGDKTGLKQSDFVSCLNPASHAIIDTVNLNIGECSINRTDRQYPLIAKLKYLCRYSTKARNTFLKTFEEYIDDTDEKLKTVSKLLFYKIKQILITNFTSVNYFWIFFYPEHSKHLPSRHDDRQGRNHQYKLRSKFCPKLVG